jgi:ornithine decarboxylase
MKDPVFEISKKKIIKKYNELKNLNLKVSYSVKTNPDITSILEEDTDSLFSIHSLKEADYVKDKSKIMFFTQALDKGLLDNLIEKGIDKIVVDNKEDLDIIEAYINEKKVKLELTLRMKLKEHTIFTEKYFVYGMGSDLVNDAVLRLKDKVSKIGVHIHKKSQNVSEWSFKEELVDTLRKEVLEKLDFVNIGGGLPVKYKNSSDRYIDSIFEKLKELRDWLGEYNIESYIEPGRFIAANAGVLKVYVKSILDENIIIVNASVYNTIPDILNANVKLLIECEGEGNEYRIKGCTPTRDDIFRYSVNLRNVKKGDELIFLNATAYNYYSDFCSLEKIKTKIVE